MTAAPPVPAFDLQVAVTRPDLAEWLAALPDDQRGPQVEQALAVGHQVLTFIQASASDESMTRMFRPVLDRMNQLDGRLQTMLAGAEKSQKLGKLGARVVASQLQEAFPTDVFRAEGGHQAAASCRTGVVSNCTDQHHHLKEGAS